MYLNSINLLRVVAIILIVASHCDLIAGISPRIFLHRLLINLTAGATVIFVFISGFLYHHIFYLKRRTHVFFKKRVKRLLIPYLILSTIPILYKLHYQPNFWSSFISEKNTGFFYEYIYPIFLFLISGEHLVAYWYIPFAILLFIGHPLHTMFIKTNNKIQIVVMISSLIIAFIVQRPLAFSLLLIQSLIYFTPAYLFGIYCSINKEKIYHFFKNKAYVFLIPFLIILFAQTYMNIEGNSEKSLFSYEGMDSIFPQKIFLCLFLLVYLHRFESYRNKYLSLIANTSFAIYFLHGYLLRFFHIVMEQLQVKEFSYPILFFFIITSLLVVISILLALLTKRIFKDNSGYITGY